ncbi:MAG: hypothetical protein CL930_05960 [Deltaproteobacteria bacterium]|nr:hypothetical protein [Deltaproteobacteria bacterium]
MCIACRKRASSQNMIPLGVSPEGSLLVGTACIKQETSGKRGWLCTSKSCVDKAMKRPHLLVRATQKESLDLSRLREDVRSHLQECWESDLQLANRQGLIRSGHSIFESKDPENFIGILIAADAGTKIKTSTSFNFIKFKTTLSSTNKASLGALIGKGPRAVVGLRSGQATRRLIGQLQRWDSLG